MLDKQVAKPMSLLLPRLSPWLLGPHNQSPVLAVLSPLLSEMSLGPPMRMLNSYIHQGAGSEPLAPAVGSITGDRWACVSGPLRPRKGRG